MKKKWTSVLIVAVMTVIFGFAANRAEAGYREAGYIIFNDDSEYLLETIVIDGRQASRYNYTLMEDSVFYGEGLKQLDVKLSYGYKIVKEDGVLQVKSTKKTIAECLEELKNKMIGFAGVIRSINWVKGDIDHTLELQPGNQATLLSNYPVEFSWDDSFGSLTIRDVKSKKIIKDIDKIQGKKIELKPKELGLREGKTYKIGFNRNGTPEIFVKVVKKELEREILDGMKKIIEEILDRDGRTLLEEERLLIEATYLQTISDMQPEKMDLYWMSYQLLERAGRLCMNRGIDEELMKMIDHYKGRAYRHIVRD